MYLIHLVPLKTIILILGRCMGLCSLTVYKTLFWINRGLEQLRSNFGGLRSNSLPVQCTSKEIRICFHVVRIKIRSINLNGTTMSYIFSCFLFYVVQTRQLFEMNQYCVSTVSTLHMIEEVLFLSHRREW